MPYTTYPRFTIPNFYSFPEGTGHQLQSKISRSGGSHHRVPGVPGMVPPENLLEFQSVFSHRNNVRDILILEKREHIVWVKTPIKTEYLDIHFLHRWWKPGISGYTRPLILPFSPGELRGSTSSLLSWCRARHTSKMMSWNPSFYSWWHNLCLRQQSLRNKDYRWNQK